MPKNMYQVVIKDVRWMCKEGGEKVTNPKFWPLEVWKVQA
jgi:hypothetical protein